MPQQAITVTAPAKINLYLGVHAQTDAQGYHTVDSVMTAIDLADELAIAPADELSVVTVPAADFPQEENSAYRAAVALGEAFGRTPAFAITITKRIPIRAGLGGPSTDAAAALVGLCDFWGIDPQDPRVLEVARSIGADVPFFLYGPPAYLSRRGDVMEEQFSSLAGVPVALVKPLECGVTAREAYLRFDEDPIDPAPLAPMLEALRAQDEAAVFAHVQNNLAPAARAVAPVISGIVDWLRAQPGVRAADVSGSGSCSFAICDSEEAAARIATTAQTEHGWWAHAARMEKSGPSIVRG